MEDPKAWKPRKAWHFTVKEKGAQIHHLKNRIQSQAPMWVGVRYHNCLAQALGQEWNVLGSIWARA